jgi:hypothetical protein
MVLFVYQEDTDTSTIHFCRRLSLAGWASKREIAHKPECVQRLEGLRLYYKP